MKVTVNHDSNTIRVYPHTRDKNSFLPTISCPPIFLSHLAFPPHSPSSVVPHFPFPVASYFSFSTSHYYSTQLHPSNTSSLPSPHYPSMPTTISEFSTIIFLLTLCWCACSAYLPSESPLFPPYSYNHHDVGPDIRSCGGRGCVSGWGQGWQGKDERFFLFCFLFLPWPHTGLEFLKEDFTRRSSVNCRLMSTGSWYVNTMPLRALWKDYQPHERWMVIKSHVTICTRNIKPHSYIINFFLCLSITFCCGRIILFITLP